MSEATTTEEPTKKKRNGPRPISERLQLVREAGKAKLAKLEAKRIRKHDELMAVDAEIAKLRDDMGYHEGDDDDAHTASVIHEDSVSRSGLEDF